jgi:hypothetical protein
MKHVTVTIRKGKKGISLWDRIRLFRIGFNVRGFEVRFYSVELHARENGNPQGQIMSGNYFDLGPQIHKIAGVGNLLLGHHKESCRLGFTFRRGGLKTFRYDYLPPIGIRRVRPWDGPLLGDNYPEPAVFVCNLSRRIPIAYTLFPYIEVEDEKGSPVDFTVTYSLQLL